MSPVGMACSLLLCGSSMAEPRWPRFDPGQTSFWRAADGLPHVGIREEQVVIDEPPALLRGIDHAQSQPFELGLLCRPDPADAAGKFAREFERAVVGGSDDGNAPRRWTHAFDRGREHVDVDIRRSEY